MLGLRGWSGNVTPPACGSDSACATLGLVRDLFGLGATEEAMLILQGWSTDRSADTNRGSVATARALLEGARLAYAAGKTPVGIRLAQRAFDACAQRIPKWRGGSRRGPTRRFRLLYVPLPESWAHDSLDRALLRAVAWQESRFDPEARSRSDAIGLLPAQALGPRPTWRAGCASRRRPSARCCDPGAQPALRRALPARLLSASTATSRAPSPPTTPGPTHSPSTPPRCARRAATRCARRCSASTRPTTT